MYSSSSSLTTSPVSGCSVISRSISSPNISIRTASSSYCGMISMVSPRTRNVPRVKAMSLRVYCMPTSCRSMESRSIVSPTLRVSMRSTYSWGVPRP